MGGGDLARLPAASDYERVRPERAGVGSLAHLHSALDRAANHLARHCRRVGDAVLAADHRAEHVVHAQPVDLARIAVLDRHAERALQLGALLEPREALPRGRDEHVPHLPKELGAEGAQERDRRLRQAHLCRGRELLPHAAHRAAGRARHDLARVAEDDVAGARFGQVVRDGRADRAGAGYDDASSHASSSVRSVCDSCLSGQRTSG